VSSTRCELYLNNRHAWDIKVLIPDGEDADSKAENWNFGSDFSMILEMQIMHLISKRFPA
jgi:hypothetical protein